MNRQDATLAKKKGLTEPSAEFDALVHQVIGAALELPEPLSADEP